MLIDSPVWRLTHLYQFKPKEGGLRTFKPNKFQAERYNRILPKFYARKAHKEIELKSRKFGTTTGMAFFCLDCVSRNRSIEAATVAHKDTKASEIFNVIVRPAWDDIPKVLRPTDRFNNTTEIDLMLSIRSKYSVSGDLKGSTPDILHLTEVAYFPSDEKLGESIASLPPHGICVAESTAYGEGNWFNTTFMEAWTANKAGKYHEWHAVFNPWHADAYNRVTVTPEMTLRYEAEARALQERYGLSDEQIFWWDQRKTDHRGLVYQFYPSEPEEAFLSSGRPVFDLKNLKALRERFERPPLRVESDVQIWEEPIEGEFYGIGVDTAEGLAHGDNSVIEVVRQSTGEEVAQVSGKISPHELAKKLGIMARLFPDHTAIIERNNHGHSVINYAKEDSTIQLYRTTITDKILDKTTDKIGWDTTESSKSVAIDGLSRSLEDQACIPHSAETFEELRTFVHGERGKMGGQPGKHDDRVMALSLASIAAKRIEIGDIVII